MTAKKVKNMQIAISGAYRKPSKHNNNRLPSNKYVRPMFY